MRQFFSNAALALVLTVLCVAVLFGVNRLAAPMKKILPPTGASSPDYKMLIGEISEPSLLQDLLILSRSPSRFSGSRDCEMAGEYIAHALRESGYKVLEQPCRLTLPVTKYARVLDEAGRELDGIRIHPFLPNWFRTVTTPEGGIRGRVLRGELGSAEEFKGAQVEGNFVLLPLGVSWKTAAGMGAKAVFYFDDGRPPAAAGWEHHVDASVNIPRFLVTGDPKRLEGRTVTVQARVDFEQRTVRNLVGVLEAKDPQGEALVVNAFYDAYSYVPDQAPGAQQACGAAVLLAAARHLAKEAPQLKRTVIIVATAGHGQGLSGIREFASALGPINTRPKALAESRAHRAALNRQLQTAQSGLAAAEKAAKGDWLGSLAGQEPEVQNYFNQLAGRVLAEDLLVADEELVRARVDWVRHDMAVHGSDGKTAPSFEVYNQARKRVQRAKTIQSTPIGQLKERWGEYFVARDVAGHVLEQARKRLQEIEFEHSRTEVRVALEEMFLPYKRMLCLSLDLTSASGRMAMVCAEPDMASGCMPADAEVAAQILSAGEELTRAAPGSSYIKTATGQPRFTNLLRDGDATKLPFVQSSMGAPLYFESSALLYAGCTAFALVTLDDSRAFMGTPNDSFDRISPAAALSKSKEESPIANLCYVARLTVATLSQMARGQARFIPISLNNRLYDISGEVVCQIGDNLTPSHPMSGATVRFLAAGYLMPPGVGRDVCLTADWDGKFHSNGIWARAIAMEYAPLVSIDTAVLRPRDGQILWTLSTPQSGPLAPYAAQKLKLQQFDRGKVRAVVFRATPVQVVGMPDPSTFQPYAQFDFMEKKGLVPSKEFKMESAGGCDVCFVPADTYLYFTFKKGDRANPNLTRIAALALGVSTVRAGGEDGKGAGDEEVFGPGYLAADTPAINNIELDVALSMAKVNDQRVQLQKQYGMADEMIVSFNERAKLLASEARELSRAGKAVEAKLAALESVAYSANIYSVIRKNASDAIWGILFYLFLAIPFAVFLEKLLIGSADIRHQMAFQGVIFGLFFLGLRLVHPAYALVQSPFMILLGFVTFALAAMVSAFVLGKFVKNVTDLTRKLHQRVEAVDVSRAGAAAVAFMLGLGNLRKRPVRTALTMVTLILITFVMICFTSVRSDLVDVEFALGKSLYTGLLVRGRNLQDVTAAMVPLRELYGEKHLLAPRSWGGVFSVLPMQSPQLAQYAVTRKLNGKTLEATAHAILGLSANEASVTTIKEVFPVLNHWIQKDTDAVCCLPRSLADKLRLTDSEVRDGSVTVTIGGREYTVLGIFDENRLETMLDVDGQALLPIDILSVQQSTRALGGQTSAENAAEIPESVPRLPARSVVITAIGAMPASTQMASIAVGFRGLDYASSRKAITAHLERSGEMAYYGLDGIAFYGGRMRMGSLRGFIDLLLPICLAALTVLNTMRGSVYERKKELYVFSAVGLSPTHIRWLFIAEAAVYAVVGVVGGYLLAQGVGTTLKILGLTAGLSMNYSSLSCVVVSLVIMGVVFVSSLFPARMAARLAAPSETMERERKSATGDTIELELPFTFNRRDRVAIIPYFADWFQDHGEGSAGDFFCAPPECGVKAEHTDGVAPFVKTTTWLKPYDLGVSQQVEVVVRRDLKSKDNVATVVMTRQSGDRESWERRCHAFIGLLRRRFLTWRAIPEVDRNSLLERGRELLDVKEGSRPSA